MRYLPWAERTGAQRDLVTYLTNDTRGHGAGDLMNTKGTQALNGLALEAEPFGLEDYHMTHDQGTHHVVYEWWRYA